MVAAQRAEEGHRAPVAMRRKASQPLALGSPAAQRGHAGLDPGLVDEHQPFRIKAGLPGSPTTTPARYVGAGLLKGE